MMMVESEMLGKHLKRVREEFGYSQIQLANLIGVSRQTISNWENDKTIPDAISLMQLADSYPISLDELCGRAVLQKPNLQSVNRSEMRQIIGLMLLLICCLLFNTTNFLFFGSLFLCSLAVFLYSHFQKQNH